MQRRSASHFHQGPFQVGYAPSAKRALVTALLVLACGPRLDAAEYVVITSLLTIERDGVPWDFDGNLYSSSVVGGTAQFAIGGDLVLGPGDSLRGVGSLPASFLVGNNMIVDPAASIDFSAIGTEAGAGGGAGGGGGLGGAGGAGGAGGKGGGIQWVRGGGAFMFLFGAAPPPIPGLNGHQGGAGLAGAAGDHGINGAAGGTGYGNLASQASGGAWQHDSTTYTNTGGGGAYGSAAPFFPSPVPFSEKDGGWGFSGLHGADGLSGAVGGNGDGGQFISDSANDFGLVAGNGGGGGAGGQGGDGGGGGGGGGGGASGQGNWATVIIPPLPPTFLPGWNFAGFGGAGGPGSDGGAGGFGGQGGQGGAGGGGGGAAQFLVQGNVLLNGTASATGADGAAGANGDFGLSGGEPGFYDTSLNIALSIPILGVQTYPLGIIGPGIAPSGFGGRGAPGASGGLGGRGAAGGAGGGGSGGTLKFVGTSVQGNANIDVSGGGGINPGADGQLLVGSNVVAAGSSASGTLGGATLTGNDTATQLGTRAANPLIASQSIVPTIAGLQGGAEAFGFTGLNANDIVLPNMQTLIDATPQEAFAGLVRFDLGPGTLDDPYLGYDMLLVYEAKGTQLSNPLLGIGEENYFVPLLNGGWQNDLRFGGTGDTVVTTMNGFDVYATLIPEDAEWFNLSVDSGGVILSNSQQFLANGEVMYVTSSPDVSVLNATWIAGNGSWSNGTNWSMVFDATGLPPTGSEDPIVPGIPSNSAAYAFNIVIDQDVVVDADIAVAVDQLNIGADDRVTVLAGQALTIERFAVRTDSGKINNDGEIFLDGSVGNTSRLFVSGPGLMLDGTGVLRTTTNTDNVIAGLRDGDSLTQFADHSIEAAGALGNNRTAITNYGRIESIGNLTINPTGSAERTSAAMTNYGVIEVDGANTLRMVDGFFHNATGGLIESKFVDRIEVTDARLVNDGSILLNINSRIVFSGLAMLTGNDIETDPYYTHIDITGAMMVNQTRLVGVTTIDNSVVNNSGGQFGGYAATQDDWSTTAITDSSIVGGTLDGYVSADDSSFRDITFLPDAKLDGGHIGLVGTIDNQMSGPSGTASGFGVVDRIDLLGDTTFTGSGFARGVFEATEIYSINPLAETYLTLMPGVTLVTTHLQGTPSPMYIDNRGTIEAPEGTGELLMVVEELRNRGVVRAGNLNMLHFSGGSLENTGGVIESSSTTLEWSRLTGGVLRSDNLHVIGETEIQGTQLLTTVGGSDTLTIDLDVFAELTLRDVALGARTVINGAEQDESLTFLNGVEFDDDGILELAFIHAKFVEDVRFQGSGKLTIDTAGLGAAPSVSPRLTFGEQFTVEGISGADEPVNLGTDSLYLENHGTIVGYDLLVDPIGDVDDAEPGLVNRGTIVGDVHIEHAYVDNTDGVIGNGVTLAGVNVRGGTLDSVHFTLETIDPDSQHALHINRLEDVTLEGSIETTEDLELILAGAIENNATVQFSEPTFFLPDGAARLTGTGVMEFGASLELAATNPGDTLTNEAGHTLDFSNSPETDYDFGDVRFINNGTIIFNSANLQTSLTSQTLPVGTVVPDLSDPENPDAVMTLTEEATYTVVTPFTNTGTLQAGDLHLTDNVIRNTGDLAVSEFYLDNGSVLNHGGALGAGLGSNVYLNGASYLTGGAANDITIVVSDSLGFGPGGIASMNLDGTTLTATSPVQLAGEVGKIAQLEINNPTGVATVLIENDDTVIEVANTDVIAGKLLLAAGVYRTDTFDSAIPAPLEWTGGRLEVDIFDGSLMQDGGTLAVGNSTGMTHITGDYEQSGGSMEIELAGTTAGIGYDQVLVDGAATLAGNLELVLLDFTPVSQEVFTILAATDLTGTFANVASGERLDVTGGYGSFVVEYSELTDTVQLSHFVALAGDYNFDGVVNLADYTVWRDHLGAPAGSLANDLDDGVIGAAQYATWKANFGDTLPELGSVESGIVPEPATWLLLSLGTLVLWRLRGSCPPAE